VLVVCAGVIDGYGVSPRNAFGGINLGRKVRSVERYRRNEANTGNGFMKVISGDEWPLAAVGRRTRTLREAERGGTREVERVSVSPLRTIECHAGIARSEAVCAYTTSRRLNSQRVKSGNGA
jgi:hypothetical protein